MKEINKIGRYKTCKEPANVQWSEDPFLSSGEDDSRLEIFRASISRKRLWNNILWTSIIKLSKVKFMIT